MEEKKLSCVICGVSTVDDEEIYFNSGGYHSMDDPSSGKIDKDSIFWICSQTKLVAHARSFWKVLTSILSIVNDAYHVSFTVGCSATYRKRETSCRYPCIHLSTRVRKPHHFRWHHGRKTIVPTRNEGRSGSALAELLKWSILSCGSASTCSTDGLLGTSWRGRPRGELLQPHQGQSESTTSIFVFAGLFVYSTRIFSVLISLCRATCLLFPSNLNLVPTVSL